MTKSDEGGLKRMTCQSFHNLAWAAVLYRGASSDDIEYTTAGTKNRVTYIELVRTLQSLPATVEEDTVERLVRFLNGWGKCRMRNNDRMRRKLRDRLENLPRDLRSLPPLEHAEFSSSTKECVEKAYSTLQGDPPWRVGPTPISKILHLVHPTFFVMWDEAIRAHYHKEDEAIDESGRGYVEYLVKMQNMAQHAIKEFCVSYPDERASLATFLSKRLDISPPGPLTKFLDEYNWLKITKRGQVPPKWHPCHG